MKHFQHCQPWQKDTWQYQQSSVYPERSFSEFGNVYEVKRLQHLPARGESPSPPQHSQINGHQIGRGGEEEDGS